MKAQKTKSEAGRVNTGNKEKQVNQRVSSLGWAGYHTGELIIW